MKGLVHKAESEVRTVGVSEGRCALRSAVGRRQDGVIDSEDETAIDTAIDTEKVQGTS